MRSEPPSGTFGGVEVIEYRLLGPLEVVVAGRPVKLGGPRQRAVLAPYCWLRRTPSSRL